MLQIAINILSTAGLHIIVGLSVFFYFLSGRFFNLSHAGLVAIGGYATYSLHVSGGLPLIWATLGGLLCCCFIGLLLEVCCFRRLAAENAKGWALLLVSIGLLGILQNAISLIFGDNVKSLMPGVIRPGTELYGAYFTSIQSTIILAALSLFFLAIILLHFTRIGRTIRGVSVNPELCELLGINQKRVTLVCSSIAAVLAGLVGILSGLDASISPRMGFPILVNGIVVLIIGGIGRCSGLVWASLFLAALQHVVSFYFGSKWIEAVGFVVLIGFLAWRPLGFNGDFLKKVGI